MDRIFVAGATGALGRPLVRRLAETGADVVGLTRFRSRTSLIRALGAKPVVADALDGDALSSVLVDAHPDAVVHALTAVPRRGPLRRRDLAATNRLRRAGTANLLAAARQAGTRRFVAESMIFVYGFGDQGDELNTEDRRLDSVDAKPGLAEAVEAVRDLEAQVRSATTRGEIDGVILRFGFFYGPGAGSELMARLLRRRMLPVAGAGEGLGSWVHIDDAAAATAAALTQGRSGEIYNVVDDETVRYREFADTFARLVGAPEPYRIPVWLARLIAPMAVAVLGARIPISNAKAKRELGWSPRFPTYREGIEDVVKHLSRPGERAVDASRDAGGGARA